MVAAPATPRSGLSAKIVGTSLLAFSCSILFASLASAAVAGLSTDLSVNATASLGSSEFSLSVSASGSPIKKACVGSPLPPKGTAGKNEPFWLEVIKHQGTSPFNRDPAGYRVFRNVKDFGAVGDGIHDDTAAINAAIQYQGRCGGGTCPSSTVTPAIVYFPKGTYLVSSAIVPYWYTQLIGNAKNPPTLLAAPTFNDMAVIDANPYIPGGGGAQYWVNQNNFFRVVRNFVIDVRQVPPEKPQGTGLHWQVSQATSLANIVVHMSTAPNTAHQGIWMENGSGGYMGDLVFNGGKFGIWGGNQQFTVRNITINNAQTGVYSLWNWGWTYQGVTIRNCQIGFDIATGGLTLETQTTGGQAIIDALVVNTPTFIRTSRPSVGSLAGSLVLNNIQLQNVGVAVGVEATGAVVLTGGTRTIASWGQGNVYRGNSPNRQFVQGNLPNPSKPASLLDGAGRIVGRTHPQYEDYRVSDFVSVKDYGAKGDGRTDDTQAIRNVLNQFAGCKIIFFDAGHYIVTDTVYIPPGTRMVGEAWTVLAGKGARFADQRNPRVVFQVGKPGEVGIVEVTDIIFSTVGPASGAIIVEWNIHEPANTKAGAGMWDSHIRTGGTAGSQLEGAQCPESGAGGIDACYAAFLSLHITKQASGYFESTWVWLADHDLDHPDESKITVYSGRGLLSESQGPVWLIGTGSEHHAVYQYRFLGARDHYMGLIQTESPYYQPTPAAPEPFVHNPTYDPAPYNEAARSAWALHIEKSKDLFIFGAGLYSFFKSYSQDCVTVRNCQTQIANIDRASSGINIFQLSTVAADKQLSVNGQGVINQADNINGFASTVTLWSSE